MNGDELKFITTEPLDNAGEAEEKLVWQIIQQAFLDRECIAYWRYPIFSQVGKYRKEPDILIVDRRLGLIVIEIKAITINNLVQINGHRWQYRDFYTDFGNPYQQAEKQLFTLLKYCDREPILQHQITARALVSLPLIDDREWQEKGFDLLPSNPPIIFKNHLSADSICQTIANMTPVINGDRISEIMDEQSWQLLLSVLAGTKVFCQPNHPVFSNTVNRGIILQKLRSHISQLDLEQEKIAKQIPPGMQRIRGIAGSGKTVLLCQKAAHMHLKHPDWKIALVFFSRSLYQTIIEQVDQWLRYFSGDLVGYKANNSNLLILHAWGAKKQPGLYSTICKIIGIDRLTVGDTESKKPNQALAEACLKLLESTTIPQIFDAILIDEGQDLIVDNYQYENKQPFYWLAYQVLRPANSLKPEQKRLIWAYDEAQSLESLKIPTASELLGENLGHLVTGKYPGEINKSEILYRCYRTPHEILTAAHAIGMGLLRPGGMLTGITRAEEWQAIGYQVQGQFQIGEKITIKRPIANSPHPIYQLWQGKLIEFKTYFSRQEELTALANNIFQNLRHEGLRPSREILIIVLGTFYEAIELEKYLAQFLIDRGIDIYLPGSENCNIMQIDKSQDRADRFWYEGAVTITRIHRAKGHEADLVYLVGLDHIAQKESDLYLRNQLFIALTRAKCWVNLSGIGSYSFYQEMHRVIQSKDTFTFIFRNSLKREIIGTETGELFKRLTLGGKNFQNINLENAQLAGICLQDANLIGANLIGANLKNARLDGAKLVVADLTGANLTGASLRGTKSIGAIFQAANLTNVDLTDADLSNANLSDAILTQANLTNTNLSNVNFDRVDLSDTNINDALTDPK